MQWKDFLYFNRRERNGIIVLILIIIACSLAPKLYDYLSPSRTPLCNKDEFAQEYAQWIEHREDSLAKLKVVKSALSYKPFNPNDASLEELIACGVPRSVSQNIVNYRSKGGKYRKPADLLKLYAMSDSLFHSLAPYITIPQVENKTNDKKRDRVKTDFVKDASFVRSIKFQHDTLIDLNTSDTTLLKMIPGIGSYTAQKIIRYRERLGGFTNTAQLLEIKVDTTEFEKWFCVDTASLSLQQMDINHEEFKSLLRHPYFSYEQVKAIFNFKRKHGEIKSIKQLQLMEQFNANSINRLRPYLRFN